MKEPIREIEELFDLPGRPWQTYESYRALDDRTSQLLGSIGNQVFDWNLTARGDEYPEYPQDIQLRLIREELKELHSATTPCEYLKELCDCFIVFSYHMAESGRVKEWRTCYADLAYDFIDATLRALKPKYLAALQLVMDSNQSKFDMYDCEREDEYEEHCQELMLYGRYANVDWAAEGGLVVYLDGKGKILKGMNYVPCDLSVLFKPEEETEDESTN